MSILLVKSGGPATLAEWQRNVAEAAPGLAVHGWDDPAVDPAQARLRLPMEAGAGPAVSGAVLDVFAEEPPPGRPAWTHPLATVAPHLASLASRQFRARCVAEVIRRDGACAARRRGLPFGHAGRCRGLVRAARAPLIPASNQC